MVNGINTIFEDDSLLVLDKPPGLVVTKTETQTEPTLEDWLQSNFHINLERSGVVHRLDKDTSGLLVVAKAQEAFENLKSQFKGRTVSKEYLALVHGFIEKGGKIEAAVGRNPGNREKFTILEEEGSPRSAGGAGREAVTEYEPIENLQFTMNNVQKIFEGFNKIQMRKIERSGYGKFTLVKCHPLTGRTHQIRVHLKYIGFPIVGDSKYGGRKTVRLDHRFCPRQFLHAAKLEFTHPKSGERMKFESKLPEDLQATLSLLKNEL